MWGPRACTHNRCPGLFWTRQACASPLAWLRVWKLPQTEHAPLRAQDLGPHLQGPVKITFPASLRLTLCLGAADITGQMAATRPVAPGSSPSAVTSWVTWGRAASLLPTTRGRQGLLGGSGRGFPLSPWHRAWHRGTRNTGRCFYSMSSTHV